MIIVIFSLAVRTTLAVFWQARLPAGQAFVFPDSESYSTLAQRIAEGETYRFDGWLAFRAPGYPVALAPLFWFAGDGPPVLAMRCLGAVFGTVVVVGVGCLAWKLFDERAGLFAAAMGALYPGAIAMSILVLSEALFCPLMIGQVLAWTWACVTDKSRQANGLAAAAGALAGLATLTRPSWLLFTPLAIVVSMVFSRTRERHMKVGIVMLCAMAVTMAPWWIRNADALRAFVPTTTQVGASLYDGLRPGATGASDMSFVPRVEREFRRRRGLGEETRRQSYEVALNRFFAAKALQHAGENPAPVARLAVVKLARMWNIWPNEASLRSWPMRLTVAAGYLPIVALGLVGAWRFSRRGWPYVLCWLPAVYFSLLHMVFVGSIRYRQPPMLLLIVLAAGCASALWQRKFCRD